MINGFIKRFAVCFTLIAVMTATAVAHPVSLTRALVHVTPEHITAKIDVFVEDLYLFHALEPNVQDFLEPDVIDTGVEKHKQFLLERFVIRDVEGQPLDGRMVGVDKSALPDEGVPLAELMAYRIVFEIQYDVSQAPEFLTFGQHFSDELTFVPAEMKLVIKQQTAPTPEETTLRANRPEIFRFSWTNPPLSHEASQQQWEEWLEEQSKETLGITSYSSVYSFLYIEDREVRHEILVPLLALEESVLIARDDDDFLDIAEQDEARRQLEAYFTSGNPVKVNGALVEATVQRCDFYGLDFKDFAMMSKRRPVSLVNARVGIILSYPIKDAPKTVEVTWDRFSNSVYSVDMVVFAYDNASKTTLSRVGDNDTFSWQSPPRPPKPTLSQVSVVWPPAPTVSVPVVSLSWLALLPVVVVTLKVRRATVGKYVAAAVVLVICAGASWPLAHWDAPDPFVSGHQLSDEEADEAFRSLHQNVFLAFDYRDESEIYDALSKSVSGSLRDELYLETRKGLIMEEQGGAVSRIRDVKIIEDKQQEPNVTHSPDGAFRYDCKWTVSGTVEHWGHIHARTNEHRAVFTVEPQDGHWKITDIELPEVKRLEFNTELRRMKTSSSDEETQN